MNQNQKTVRNPFTLSFGTSPTEYIARIEEKSRLVSQIEKEPPLSHCFVITGLRGSGKTVMLNSVSESFRESDDWIVIEVNPEDDMREALAAKLYTAGKTKRFFLEKNFSVSFKGISFSLTGKNPVLNIDDLLERMLSIVKKEGKKVLVLIDEVSSTQKMKQFALSFQILIRNGLPLFLLATGLFENISSLENEKNLTFLIRAPKLFLSPLNLSGIASSYEKTIGTSPEESLHYAKLTKGYAFSFQLLGYLLFEKKEDEDEKSLLRQYDQYLAEYVYRKVWSSLSPTEQKLLRSFRTNGSINVKDILERNDITKEYFSRYRDRLLKNGVLISPARGTLAFALPRFKEFIDANSYEDQP